MILVIPRQLFDELGAFQGLSLDADRYLKAIVNPENNLFLPRSLAEEDPTHKQIIPYVLLVHQGRVLTYVRGKSGGEQRLVTKRSIGIGGHLNDTDSHRKSFDQNAYLNGVQREVTEELDVRTTYSNSVRGLVNDDSNEVGSVHLGIVHVFELESDDVRPRESNITSMSFCTPEELRAQEDALESWSKICLGGIEQLIQAGAEAR